MDKTRLHKTDFRDMNVLPDISMRAKFLRHSLFRPNTKIFEIIDTIYYFVIKLGLVSVQQGFGLDLVHCYSFLNLLTAYVSSGPSLVVNTILSGYLNKCSKFDFQIPSVFFLVSCVSQSNRFFFAGPLFPDRHDPTTPPWRFFFL